MQATQAAPVGNDLPIDSLIGIGRRLANPLAVVALCGVVFATTLVNSRPELNTAPDEASLYVTALMLRSYVAHGLGRNPREFAEEYYVHYPKVAFGVWPPAFHLLLGGWLLITGPSLASAMLFVSVTTMLVCFVMFRAARDSLGAPLALATGIWFATLPAVQSAASSVMMDGFCALFMLSAAVSFARYMEAERTRDALWFAVLASVAILTKYNALALALLPPVAVIAARRWTLPRRANFWLMPVVVAVLCAPWYVMEWGMVSLASEPWPDVNAWKLAAVDNPLEIVRQIGFVAVPLAVVGLFVRVVRRPADHALWCSLFALATATWAFHSFVYPISGGRYLLVVFAAAALFAAAGLQWVATHLPWPRAEPAQRIRVAAFGVLVLVLTTFSPAAPRLRGFAEAGELVLPRLPSPDVTALVSSDPIGEGAFVAYVATREPYPRSFVLRASKLLASDTWMGLDYQQRYPDAGSMRAALNTARVAYVVLDDVGRDPHHQLLDEAVSSSADWALMHTGSTQGGVRVYERTQPLPPGKPQFELQTRYSLGRALRAPK